ncbi:MULTISPECIES: hypothetical protein [unclassified Geodermatophilus]
MSAPAPPAPSLPAPVAAGDGLGIADLVALLGLEPATDPCDDLPGRLAPARRPVDVVATVRAWVRRAAAWGSGPQRSWCAW